MPGDGDEALAADAADGLREILELCRRLSRVGATRVVFTSREALPEPFASDARRIELGRLRQDDAVKLVERTLRPGAAGAALDAAREAIEDLVQLFSLLKYLGKPCLLEKVGGVRAAASKALGEHWSHAQFEAQRTRIEQLLDGGHLREALEATNALHQHALAAGESAYEEADYDIATSCLLLGRVLKWGGAAGQALPFLLVRSAAAVRGSRVTRALYDEVLNALTRK